MGIQLSYIPIWFKTEHFFLLGWIGSQKCCHGATNTTERTSGSLWGLQRLFFNSGSVVKSHCSRCSIYEIQACTFWQSYCSEWKLHVDILWILRNKLVLKKKEMLRIMCETVREPGELTIKGRVKDEEETERMKTEARPDKNSPREPEILIIQEWESLILDQCRRLLEPLLTVTNKACMLHNCVAVILLLLGVFRWLLWKRTRSPVFLFTQYVSIHVNFKSLQYIFCT